MNTLGRLQQEIFCEILKVLHDVSEKYENMYINYSRYETFIYE